MSNVPENPRKALGKGLSSLLPARPVALPAATPPQGPQKEIAVTKLPIEEILPNPLQPRYIFEGERLGELAQSIRANGVIQPLIVRKHEGQYFLIAGERRWRAAKLAGLLEVPVVVQDIADDRLLEVALIENIQREDLNAIEVAQAFEKLSTDLGLSHEEIGHRTGKDRATVTNMLRLLRLPDEIKLMIAERRLSMGHARALISLPGDGLQVEAAEKAAAQGFSVRQVEQLVKKMTETREPKKPSEVDQDPNVQAAIRELENALGTKVRMIEKSPGRGRIEIDYYSSNDLDRIYAIIVGESL